jgi:hypothetical protein
MNAADVGGEDIEGIETRNRLRHARQMDPAGGP